MFDLPGPGDEATWGRCTGHPHDPRTEDFDAADITWDPASGKDFTVVLAYEDDAV